MSFGNATWIALALVLFVAESSATGADKSASGVKITVTPSELDFGEVEPSESPSKPIVIQNDGKEPVTVVGVSSTCFCTVVSKMHPFTLKRGESKEIEVTLNLQEYPSNNVDSRIVIRVGDEENAVATVTVRGGVIAELAPVVERLDLGKITLGQTVARTFQVRVNAAGARVQEVRCSEGLRAEVDSELAVDSDGHASQRIRVSATPVTNRGRFNGILTLQTNVSRVPKLEIRVIGEVVGVDYALSAKVLVMGPGVAHDLLGNLTVKGSGTLQVIAAEADRPQVHCTVSRTARAGEFQIKVSLDSAIAARTVVGRITLRLQDGGVQEDILVPYFATVGIRDGAP